MVHRSSLFYLGVTALLTFSLLGCTQHRASKDQKGGGQRGGRGGVRGGGAGPAVHVQTASVQRISIQRSIELSGTLISPDQAKVSSEVAGIVRDVLIEIGQEVAAAQELVRLDKTELNLAVPRA